jgi:hypothetical protein
MSSRGDRDRGKRRFLRTALVLAAAPFVPTWAPVPRRGSAEPTEHRLVARAATAQIEIAFLVVNPGDWMLHCHVLEHHEGGMVAWLRVT